MSVFNALGTTSPRWWRRLATIVGLSLALVVATGAPAHAAYGTLTDDFEAADAGYVWTTEHGECCYVFSNLHYHSSSHAGQLGWTSLDSWTSLGRSVHLPALLDRNTRCKATIWIDAWTFPPTDDLVVNVEVINPTDWTYIALSTLTLAPSTEWRQISTPVWTPYTSDVYFRVSNLSYPGHPYGGGFSYLDDFRVTCVWT
jgi:hypothetical protein